MMLRSRPEMNKDRNDKDRSDNVPPWSVDVLTIEPSLFPGPLGSSIIGRALDKERWSLRVHDMRTFATDRHRTVDDVPYGGGAGMVLRADIAGRALESLCPDGTKPSRRILYPSPRGVPLKQAMIRRFSQEEGLIFLCARFEGIDQRLLDYYPIEEVSLGDYILSNGEIAAMVMIDACVRMLPGVVGCEDSLEEESFTNDLLEYSHYTRPRVWKNISVPHILVSGHHERVRQWRRQSAAILTKQRRPDIWRASEHCKTGKNRDKCE